MAKQPAKKQKADKRGGKRSTSWKPGTSGNPRGRPSAGMSWAEMVIKVGDETLPNGMTRKESLVRAAFAHAMKGNAMILRELMQRSEPLPNEVTIHHDWREVAREHGLSEAAVLAEAEQILNESRHADGNPTTA